MGLSKAMMPFSVAMPSRMVGNSILGISENMGAKLRKFEEESLKMEM